MKYYDDWGEEIKEGDNIVTSYGIPPKPLKGKVIIEEGEMIVLTPGHNPEKCDLNYLIHNFNVYKETE
ncbi:MAG: hypothetical protein PQJ59_16760 [Spirochaetales bacterium]|nr:hypothetical protein [Spirochaetales bacterium]